MGVGGGVYSSYAEGNGPQAGFTFEEDLAKNTEQIFFHEQHIIKSDASNSENKVISH